MHEAPRERGTRVLETPRAHVKDGGVAGAPDSCGMIQTTEPAPRFVTKTVSPQCTLPLYSLRRICMRTKRWTGYYLYVHLQAYSVWALTLNRGYTRPSRRRHLVVWHNPPERMYISCTTGTRPSPLRSRSVSTHTQPLSSRTRGTLSLFHQASRKFHPTPPPLF